MEGRYVAIGERVTLDGVVYKCVDAKGSLRCGGCDLFYKVCDSVYCTAAGREDHKSVIFKEVKRQTQNNMANKENNTKRHFASFDLHVTYTADFGLYLTDKELAEFKKMEGHTYDNINKDEKRPFQKLYGPVCEKFSEYITVTLVNMEVKDE